jgi:hypothetical protein
MPSFSKSLFTNTQTNSQTRSLINTVSTGNGGTNELSFLTDTYLNILKIIETMYGSNMANKTYEQIPNDFIKYTNLVNSIQNIQSKTSNSTMILLLKIAEETLIGSFNSYTLHGDNLFLQLDKATLEKRVEDILSDKNVESVENTASSSNMSLTQTFQLAPVFNYYIKIYGLPPSGTGFDPVKITFLVDILQSKGIDPYA